MRENPKIWLKAQVLSFMTLHNSAMENIYACGLDDKE